MHHYVIAAMSSLFFVATAQAASYSEAKNTTSDAAAGDIFGYSSAIHGTTAIVGAPRKDGKQGAAYLFDTVTGKQTAKLTAKDAEKDAEKDDLFGCSSALSGTIAIVGASGEGEYGAAYLFDTTTGKLTAKLAASDHVANGLFGSSVAIAGTTAIVGAIGNDDNHGAAYLFDSNTVRQPSWRQVMPQIGTNSVLPSQFLVQLLWKELRVKATNTAQPIYSTWPRAPKQQNLLPVILPKMTYLDHPLQSFATRPSSGLREKTKTGGLPICLTFAPASKQPS